MKWLVLTLAMAVVSPAFAAGLAQDIQAIQSRWDTIQYQLPEDRREAALKKLSAQTEALVARYPDRAEPLIWHGITLSTYAGEKGGLGALGLVKEARAALEKAMEIDPEALNGSAYTSLGSLYYQVPGWPLGFGDDAQAREYLRQALAINPEGIDPNFFFGDFLLEQDQPERARIYLERAIDAPARPGRELADEGRKEAARKRLQTL